MEKTYNQKFTKEQKEIYVQFLSEIEKEVLRNGVKKLIMTRKFMSLPTIGEIFENCKEFKEMTMQEKVEKGFI
ncbi:MAG: hypothetical protein ACRC0V_04495 [Fusobacteriaceae bacterium]